MLSRGIEAEIDPVDIEIGDPAAVDQYQRIGRRGGAEAAHVHDAARAVDAAEQVGAPGCRARATEYPARSVPGERSMSSAVMMVVEAPVMPPPMTASHWSRCTLSVAVLRVTRDFWLRAAALAAAIQSPMRSWRSRRSAAMLRRIASCVVPRMSASDDGATDEDAASAATRARRNTQRNAWQTPRVAQVVRHRERSLPGRPVRAIGSATVSTPRPTCSRMTTADGRSPGSRVTTLRPPSRDPKAQWHDDEGFAAYSCGGSRGMGNCLPSPRSLLIPKRGTVAMMLRSGLARCQQQEFFMAPRWPQATPSPDFKTLPAAARAPESCP